MAKIFSDLDSFKNTMPLPVCRVDANRIFVKTGTQNYISSNEDKFFDSMRFSSEVKKSKNLVKVLDFSNAGSISSIILPKDTSISIVLYVDNIKYAYKLKCEDNQRCCFGYSLSDKMKVNKIDLKYKKNYPPEMSCVESTSVSKAKQISLPLLKFNKSIKIYVKLVNRNKSKMGINYELSSDYN